MFQNNGSLEYLYGMSHSKTCLAKDLANRESNILLFDEFDKASPYVYSSLYQPFDEGIFMDNYFTVNLSNSFIICTSNFTSPENIIKTLGNPIFNRIDCLIEYLPLNQITIQKLINQSFEKNFSELDGKTAKKIDITKLKDLLITNSYMLNNARQIDRLVKEIIADTIINSVN